MASVAIAVRETANPPHEADVVVTGEGFNWALWYYHAIPGGNWFNDVVGGYLDLSPHAIVVRSNGEADIVGWSPYGGGLPQNSLWYYHATPGQRWQAYQIAGAGTTFSAPAIAVSSNGEANVVAQGPNNSLMHYWATPGAQWQGAPIPGPGTVSSPAIVVRSSGETDIVARSPDNSLWYYNAFAGSHQFGSYEIERGTTFSSPAIAVGSNGQAHVVAQGPNNSLRTYRATPGSQWASQEINGAGGTFSAPDIAVRANGDVAVVVAGPNQNLWYYSAVHPPVGFPWSFQQTLIDSNKVALSAPAIAVRSSGETDVVSWGGADSGIGPSYWWYHHTTTPNQPWPPGLKLTIPEGNPS